MVDDKSLKVKDDFSTEFEIREEKKMRVKRIIGTTETGHRLVLQGGGRNVRVRLEYPGRFIAGLDRFRPAASFGPVSAALVEVKTPDITGTALRERIGLTSYETGTPEFKDIYKGKERFYVVGYDEAEIKQVTPFLTNLMFHKMTEFAPETMRRIFTEPEKWLKESEKVAIENGYLKKDVSNCAMVGLSPNKIKELVGLLWREDKPLPEVFMGGAWYVFIPDFLRSCYHLNPENRLHNIGVGFAWI